MRRILLFMVFALVTLVVACGGSGKKTNETIVSVKTSYGEIKVKLYDDTPAHKNNFVKLINEGFYTNLLFHRVINNFMIQGGDPNSRTAEPGAMLGNGGPGYTIPAEILPKYIHKKGALAAARLGGPKNPAKESSGSQFYIVQGKVFRSGELDTMEIMINNKRKDLMLRENLEQENNKLNEFKTKNDRQGFELLVAQIREKVDSIYAAGNIYKMSPDQRQAYTTIGGYPSLDSEYTVFGEVVEGLDVIDKIAAVPVDGSNRPKDDVRMNIEVLK